MCGRCIDSCCGGGAGATVSIGTTTTLAPGMAATVSQTGTSTNAIFNFGLPAGSDGATGPVGPAGVAGTNGVDAYTVSPTIHHVQSTWLAGAATAMTLTNSGYGLTAGFNGPGVPANGDSFQTVSFQVVPGTYTLYVVTSRLSNRGLITWYLDGSVISLGTMDCYLNGTDYIVQSIPGVVVTASVNNLHSLRAVISKHVSSTGYYIYLSAIWLK